MVFRKQQAVKLQAAGAKRFSKYPYALPPRRLKEGPSMV